MNSFTGDNQNQNNQANDGTTSFVDQLVGEGKKFSDVEEMAKGKLESDRYIGQLQSELEKYQALDGKLDSLISQITEANKTSPNPQDSANNSGNTNTDTQGTQASQMDAASVETLVQELLNKSQSDAVHSQNLQTVEAKLAETYGEKSREMVNAKARELGMNATKLQEIAQESPAAFFNMMGMNMSNPGGGTHFNPAQNSEALMTQNAGNTPAENERWSYFKEMKTKNPKEFYKSFGQMEALIDKYGVDTFYNT